MLSLKKLRFCNIGRFVKTQEIDFNQFDKILQVNGFNRNTGGSSGAAKSTVFHAQDYLLGINEIPATALQTRLSKSPMWVEGEYDLEGKQLTIKRSKKDGLMITLDGETISGNVKFAEEKLEEIIGIPKKLFKRMIHKKQKEGGFFLNLTAKESYDFLMNALDLNKYNDLTTKIDELIKQFTTNINDLDFAQSSLHDSINEIKELLSFEKEPVLSVDKSLLEQNIIDIKELSANLENVKIAKHTELELQHKNYPIKKSIIVSDDEINKLQDQLTTQQKTRYDYVLQISNTKKQIQNKISTIEINLSKIPYARNTISTKVNEINKLQEQKQHIKSSICPTCKQTWIGNEANQQIKQIDDKIKTNTSDILENKIIVDSEMTLVDQLKRLKDIYSNIDKDENIISLDKSILDIQQKILEKKANYKNIEQKIENEYLKELNVYNEQVTTITNKYDSEINQQQIKINNLYHEIESKKQAVKFYENALSEYTIKINKYNDSLSNKEKSIQEAINLKKHFSDRLSIAQESKRLIKAYMLQIFQDTLDYIGNYATDILSNIPNMSNATIYFEGCRETKSGSIKDEVNAIINLDGYDNINIKTLSGGERTTIDLAVDLAVIDMIESKVGKGADFFILDEPFDGLEDINIIQCLEILKQSDTNKKIIIVDHNPIAKEMINDSINIERNGEESVVL